MSLCVPSKNVLCMFTNNFSGKMHGNDILYLNKGTHQMDYLLNCSVKVRKDKIQMSSKTNKATDPLKLPNNTNN